MAVTRGEECGHGGRETVKMKRVNLMLDDETLKILDRMALATAGGAKMNRSSLVRALANNFSTNGFQSRHAGTLRPAPTNGTSLPCSYADTSLGSTVSNAVTSIFECGGATLYIWWWPPSPR
jgi:hypothetical protein